MKLSQTIPVWGPVQAGYNSFRHEVLAFVTLASVPWAAEVAFLAAMRGLLPAEDPSPPIAMRLVEDIVAAYLGSCFALALTRRRLMGPEAGRLRFSFVGAEWQFFGLLCATILLMDFFTAAADGADASDTLIIASIIVVLVALYVLIRLSLLAPAVIQGESAPTVVAWHLGRESFFWLLTLFILTSAPSLAFSLIGGVIDPEISADRWMTPLWLSALGLAFDYATFWIWIVAVADAYTAARAAAGVPVAPL